MSKRVLGSMHTLQSLCDPIEGRLSSPDGRAELVRLATHLIVEEALETESQDALGREYFEHIAGSEGSTRKYMNMAQPYAEQISTSGAVA